MLQVPPGERCPLAKMFGCVHYPLRKLQRQDEEKGIRFFFELYVYNMAEHFLTVRSDMFSLPSRFVPGHGIVFDLDPSKQTEDRLIPGDDSLRVEVYDVNVHFVSNVVCATWTGFYHHQNISFQVGVGTNNKTDNIIPFTLVSSDTDCHCFNSSKLVSHIRYMILVKASCSAGSVIVSSDGVTILDEEKSLKDMEVFVGKTCDNALSQFLSLAPNETISNGTLFKPKKGLRVGDAYTLEVTSDAAFDIDIRSADVLWLEGSVRGGLTYQKELRAMTEIPTFVVWTNNTYWSASMNISLLNCAYRFRTYSSAQTLSAFWKIRSSFGALIDAFHVSLFQIHCNDTNVLRFKRSCLKRIYGPLNMNRFHTMTFRDLSLADKTSYLVEVKACFGKTCLPSAFSIPVFIQYLPPSIKVFRTSIVSITNEYIDVDIGSDTSDCVPPADTTDTTIYQWALAFGEQTKNFMMPWSAVMPVQDTLWVSYFYYF